jgi:hypothetical protein
MAWQHLIEEVSATASKETIEEQLLELDDGSCAHRGACPE